MQRYDARHFLHAVPADLLREYLSEFGIAREIDWTASIDLVANKVFDAIEQSPEDVHRKVHCTFGMIHRLSIEEGIAMIRDEIHRRQLADDVLTALGRYPTPTGQAFWTYLNQPEVFTYAYHFGIADIIPRWHRVCVKVNKPIAPDDGALHRLEDDLRAYYQECQGRGHGCHVSVFPRDSRCYWFAYVQDYAKEVLVYDEQHQLHCETLELAFDIIFIYDHHEGTLAVATDGDLEHVRELQRLFGRAVLDEEMPYNSTRERYHIQRLLDRNYLLPLLPDDIVASVDVLSLKLEFLGHRQGGITVTAGRDPSGQRVYNHLEKALVGFTFPRDLITVAQVELYLTFRPDGGLQPEPRVIRITPMNCGCTLGPWDDALRELLRRWGLYDASPCNNPTADD